MNILFISSCFPYPPDNGSKLRAYYLIRSLARTHQVTLIAFRTESAQRKTLTGTLGFADVPLLP